MAVVSAQTALQKAQGDLASAKANLSQKQTALTTAKANLSQANQALTDATAKLNGYKLVLAKYQTAKANMQADTLLLNDFNQVLIVPRPRMRAPRLLTPWR